MLPPGEGEDRLVALIRAAAGAAGGEVVVGIGDDAAVLAGGLVAGADMLVEGVHFRAGADARAVGARAAGANLSDLAAMGAEPLCLLASLGVPPGFDAVADLAAGLASHGVPLAGGDLSRAPALVVSVAALGRAERPVLRSGARAGDVLAVTGPLGAQAAAGYTLPVKPRLAEGRALAGVATAMIDLSDGIAADARRLAEASGLGGVVELELLPRAPGATVEQAAAGGEDYELLVALPEAALAAAPVALVPVGRLRRDPGFELVGADGRPRALAGHDHFARGV